PMNTRPASSGGGGVTATSPSRISLSGTMSVDADHHVRGLDHRIGVLPRGELQFIDCLVGDRRGDDGAADIDPHVAGGGAASHIDDAAFELIAGAEFHGRLLGCHWISMRTTSRTERPPRHS